MNSSIFELRDVANSMYADGMSALTQAKLDLQALGNKFLGINNDLAQSYNKSAAIAEKLDKECCEIIYSIKSAIWQFTEQTEKIEERIYRDLNTINEEADKLLQELEGLK